MFRASSAHHQESFTVHTASSFCVCVCLQHCLVRNSFLQDSAADRHKHRNWRLYVRWGTPDDERLTLKTCRVIHIQIEYKNLSQFASVGLLTGIYEDIFRNDLFLLKGATDWLQEIQTLWLPWKIQTCAFHYAENFTTVLNKDDRVTAA
jgi:hypothetical protein